MTSTSKQVPQFGTILMANYSAFTDIQLKCAAILLLNPKAALSSSASVLVVRTSGIAARLMDNVVTLTNRDGKWSCEMRVPGLPDEHRRLVCSDGESTWENAVIRAALYASRDSQSGIPMPIWALM